MDPISRVLSRLEFMEEIWRDTCVLNAEQKKQLEDFLVEYNDEFAKNGFELVLTQNSGLN